VMDLDWFTHEAYWWMCTSAAVVWTIACLTMLLRVWVINNVWLLAFAIGIAGVYALCADVSAMKWCVVPWLQNVRKLDIMRRNAPFGVFLMFYLFSTFLQVVTIQSNAWFMVTAIQTNKEVLGYWVYIWSNSVFGSLPKSTWDTWFTPKSAAIVLWVLSTGQLILPLLTAVPMPGTANSVLFPTRKPPVVPTALPTPQSSQGCKRLQPINYQRPLRDVSLESAQLLEAQLLEEEDCVPEKYNHDFVTFGAWLLQTCTFRQSKRCTYRESVGKLALASGLRYTSSMSISYPKHWIDTIIRNKEGYKKKLEPSNQGWELRALKEFEKLASVQVNRIGFIMLLKLALQMNLQITLNIIHNIQLGSRHVFDRIFKGDIAGHISIISLLVTFSTEFLDVILVIGIFFSVRKAVKEKLANVGSKAGDVYAVHDFVSDDGRTKHVSYSGHDLLDAYEIARWKVCKMICITLFSTWLIGYALLKWFFAMYCDDGAWELVTGCLPHFKGVASA